MFTSDFLTKSYLMSRLDFVKKSSVNTANQYRNREKRALWVSGGGFRECRRLIMVRMDTRYDFKLITMEFELPAPGMRNPPDVILHGVTCPKQVENISACTQKLQEPGPEIVFVVTINAGEHATTICHA